MPFTQEQFFDVFRLYNTAVFPWQIVLHALAIVTVVFLAFAQPLKRETLAGRLIGAVLAALWAWMGVVYHLVFFATINPAAWLFGGLFILQALLFLIVLVFRRPPVFPHPNGVRQLVGSLLLLTGLMAYPLLNGFSGHEYLESPTFGTPCSTTIFTLGLLVLSRNVHWSMWLIPLAWSAIGGSAAFMLGVPQDYTLVVAGVLTVVMLLFKSTRNPRSNTGAESAG